ncbi:hypothetical protein BJX70DRAFT_399914 [Aspergillus crustosus]
MLSSITKTLRLATVLATSATALVVVEYDRYTLANCSSGLGKSTAAEGYCVNLANFPTVSYSASVTSGECEDPAASPVFSVYGNRNCESGLIDAIDVGAEAQCIEADVTIQSVGVTCV